MLETARLALRNLTLDDAELMLAVWNDPAFVRYVGDRGIRTTDDARVAMKSGALQLYEKHSFGPYRVALKDLDRPIGICGLFQRDEFEIPDLGYATLPEFCGNGYAFEAATAVIDYVRSELAIAELLAIISPQNDASVGLIRKLGFEFERMHTMQGDDEAVQIYRKKLN